MGKKAAASSKDRFCDLPDDLLRHVLSFMPRDYALQTCVLDTRWRNLWRSTTSLDIIFDGWPSIPWERFEQLVKLFIQVRGNSPLDLCKVSICDERLTKYALTCQVKELQISPFNWWDRPTFDLPVISQHLKTMRLKSVHVESFMNFLGCPVLEDLKMQCCDIYAHKISSESLKRLCITEGCTFDPEPFRIEIYAPRLISLQLDYFVGLTPMVGNMPLLQTAFIRFESCCKDICRSGVSRKDCDYRQCRCHTYPSEGGVLLNSLSNAVNLELIALPEKFVFKWDLEWCPIFGKLKTLLLGDWFNAIDLVCILRHSPTLEMLTLQFGFGYIYTENFEGATGAQETAEQPFVCANLKVVNIECHKLVERVCKILKTLSTCGIRREQISITNPRSHSNCFSFEKHWYE